MCPACGHGEFHQATTLAMREGGGLVATVKGWRCAQCREVLNMERVSAERELERLEEELRDRRERLSARTRP